MNSEIEREAFERTTDAEGCGFTFLRFTDENHVTRYASEITEAAFDGFKAATRTPSDREQKLVEALRNVEIMAWADDFSERQKLDEIDRIATEALTGYTPGSQGGEKSSVYHIPLYDADGKVTLQPVACYPADEEEAPLSEAEIAAMADEWFAGNSPNPEDQAHCREFAKALAKRLGWM